MSARKYKKFAIRTSLGEIINQSETLSETLLLYVRVNPTSSIVKRSSAKGNRNGWIHVDEKGNRKKSLI
jgi:hypothetical protein